MKLRRGFVSNSSSSSFIVKFKTKKSGMDGYDKFVTDEQEKILKKIGFVQSIYTKTSDLNSKDWGEEYVNDNTYFINYVYQVPINQDIIIETLVRHDISFSMSTDFGITTYIYDAKKELLKIYTNPGIAAEIHSDNILKQFYSDCKIRTQTKDEILKGE